MAEQPKRDPNRGSLKNPRTQEPLVRPVQVERLESAAAAAALVADEALARAVNAQAFARQHAPAFEGNGKQILQSQIFGA